jgi:hypothetical protein
VISSDKYEVKLISKSLFEVRMVLVIRNIMASDLGPYRCIAKNSLGEVESNIRLYGKFSFPWKECRNTCVVLKAVSGRYCSSL